MALNLDAESQEQEIETDDGWMYRHLPAASEEGEKGEDEEPKITAGMSIREEMHVVWPVDSF